MTRRFLDDLGWSAIVALVVLTGAFLIIPILVSVTMSVDSRNYLGPFPPPGMSFKWYLRLFSDAYYLRGLQTSLIVATTATLVSTTIGAGCAFALDRWEFTGKMALIVFFLSPLVVPAVVLGFALLVFFAIAGIFDGLTRLVLAHILITVPYVIRTTLASLSGIPHYLTEAAMSLGASEAVAFRQITLPLARTGIFAGAIFAFAFSMDDVAVSLFLSDPRSYTLPVAMINMMRGQFDLTIAAVAVVLIAMTLVLIVVLDQLVGLDRLIGHGVYKA